MENDHVPFLLEPVTPDNPADPLAAVIPVVPVTLVAPNFPVAAGAPDTPVLNPSFKAALLCVRKIDPDVANDLFVGLRGGLDGSPI